ncbi:retrovirus-related pol polyprotein from transposon TNT 1-94 [Tanacetum coccineum]
MYLRRGMMICRLGVVYSVSLHIFSHIIAYVGCDQAAIYGLCLATSCYWIQRPLVGSSVVAIVCVVVVSRASMDEILQATKVLAEDCRSRGTTFCLATVLKEVLEEFRPKDAHVKSNGRVCAAKPEKSNQEETGTGYYICPKDHVYDVPYLWSLDALELSQDSNDAHNNNSDISGDKCRVQLGSSRAWSFVSYLKVRLLAAASPFFESRYFLSLILPIFPAMSKNDMKDRICALSKNDLKDLVKTYRIPLDLHPRLPDPGFTMDRLPADAIGIYSEFLWWGGCGEDVMNLIMPTSGFMLKSQLQEVKKVHVVSTLTDVITSDFSEVYQRNYTPYRLLKINRANALYCERLQNKHCVLEKGPNLPRYKEL